MAIAARTTSTLAATITQRSLYDALKAAFIAAGFGNPYDEWIPADNSLRASWQIVLDSTKTYGTMYVRFRVATDLVVGFLSTSSWDRVAHTGSNASSEFATSAFTTTANILIDSFSAGNEFKCVSLIQGSNFFPLCFLSPTNKPVWWDLAAYPYGFISTINTFTTFSSTGLNPYANTLNNSGLSNSRLSGANPVTNKRDIELGVMLYNQSNNGISGKTSDDLVSIAALGINRFDTVRVAGNPNKDFLVLNNIAGGLGLRIS